MLSAWKKQGAVVTECTITSAEGLFSGLFLHWNWGSSGLSFPPSTCSTSFSYNINCSGEWHQCLLPCTPGDIPRDLSDQYLHRYALAFQAPRLRPFPGSARLDGHDPWPTYSTDLDLQGIYAVFVDWLKTV